jgi:hypothetical protein
MLVILSLTKPVLAVAVEKKNNPFTRVLVVVMVASLTICGASQWFIVGAVEVQLETEVEEELPKTNPGKKKSVERTEAIKVRMTVRGLGSQGFCVIHDSEGEIHRQEGCIT